MLQKITLYIRTDFSRERYEGESVRIRNCQEELRMNRRKITERQESILREIIEFKNEYGFPPTVRELCERTGLKSTSSVAAHLQALKDMGYISWVATMPRTITVLRGVTAA